VLIFASSLLAKIGFAEDAAPLHNGPWPIQHGHDYQPTENELRDLHESDVTPNQAREVDRLYDQLLASGKKGSDRRPTPRE
jgi:hypothetical protein